MRFKDRIEYSKIYHKGGFIGDVAGSLTGGLIGNDPKEEERKARKKAEEEARRQREEQERLAREQEENRRKEEEYNRKVQQDTENMQKQQQLQQQETVKGKPNTTVDFTQSIKNEDDDEDKLRKAFRTKR